MSTSDPVNVPTCGLSDEPPAALDIWTRMRDPHRMHILGPSLVCLAVAQPCFAQSNDRTTQIVTAWSDWIDAGETKNSTIVVMRAGEVVAETSIGVSTDTPMPLASLSKAVTAACVLNLSENGLFSMDMKLADVLDVPEQVADVTLAQLLTHTSGIWPDETQGNATLQDVQTDQTQSISQQAMTRDTQEGEVGVFAYSNENYAILGAVIEEVTGKAYAQACADAVLEPLGIQSATMEGEWAAHGAWGGWSMSTPDFARFAWASFGPASQIGASPEDWPATDIGNGVNFGMGVLWRENDESHLFWSSGMLCWDNSGDGGYFARYGEEWLVVTLYAECLAGTERLADLDYGLFRAAVE